MGNILYLNKTKISFFEIMCTDNFCTLRTAACNKKVNGANSDFMLTYKPPNHYGPHFFIQNSEKLKSSLQHLTQLIWILTCILNPLRPTKAFLPNHNNIDLLWSITCWSPNFNMCSGEHIYYCKKGNKTFILYQDVLLRCVGIYWEQFWHICIKYVHKIVCTIHNIR